MRFTHAVSELKGSLPAATTSAFASAVVINMRVTDGEGSVKWQFKFRTPDLEFICQELPSPVVVVAVTLPNDSAAPEFQTY